MSRRGGIIDVFPACSELPVRIEFFGNRIETLRCFDPENQRSTGPVSSVIVTPVRELVSKHDDPAVVDGTIFDYLGGDALLVLDDPQGIELTVNRLNEEIQELKDAKIEKGELPKELPSPYLTWEELESRVREKRRLVLRTWNVEGHGQALPFTRVQSY
jgi:transcription-repair coupling factor (superfamily II helicase)